MPFVLLHQKEMGQTENAGKQLCKKLVMVLICCYCSRVSWTIFIRSKCIGLLCVKGLHSSSTCQTLYSMITYKTGIPMRAIFLFKEQKFLDPSDTFAESSLTNYSVVDLHTSQSGGGKGALSHYYYTY